jgi:hypothetical protein
LQQQVEVLKLEVEVEAADQVEAEHLRHRN